MEAILKYMDDFGIHLAPYKRLYPTGLPVQSIGYLSCKTTRIKQTFNTINFSLIFEGRGDYHLDGRRWEVEAPCVITQWPGAAVEYGPVRSWTEFFIVYPPGRLKELEKMNLAQRQRPVWPMGDVETCRRLLTQVHSLAQRPAVPGVADRIDRLCEQLVVETYLGSVFAAGDTREMVIRKVRALVEAEPLEDHDFEALSYEHGFSPASFRRHWERHVGVPPGRYVTQLRIQQACRWLAETQLPIREIAVRLNFQDPLYFSRVFRSVTGRTARDYRKEHHSAFAGRKFNPLTAQPSVKGGRKVSRPLRPGGGKSG